MSSSQLLSVVRFGDVPDLLHGRFDVAVGMLDEGKVERAIELVLVEGYRRPDTLLSYILKRS